MKDHHYPHLQSLLRGKNPAQLAEAARVAGDFGLAGLLPELWDVAVHAPYYTKTNALFALQKLAPDVALKAAEEVWRDPRVPEDFYWHCCRAVRASAALLLSRAGEAAAAEFLRDLIASRDVVVTRWLAPALLQPNTPEEIRGALTLEILANPADVHSFSTPPYSEPGQLCLLCEALACHPDSGAENLLAFYAFFHSRFVRMAAIRGLQQRVGSADALVLAEKQVALWASPSDKVELAALHKDVDFLLACATSHDLGDFEKFQAVDRLAAVGQRAQASIFLSCSWGPVRQRAVEALAGESSAPAILEQHRSVENDPLVLAALEAAASSRTTL